MFFSRFDKRRQHKMKQKSISYLHIFSWSIIYPMYCDVGSDVWSQKKSFFKAQIGLVQQSWKENANLLRRLYNKDHYIFWKTCDKKSWKEESSPKGCLRIALSLVWVILVKERITWARYVVCSITAGPPLGLICDNWMPINYYNLT